MTKKCDERALRYVKLCVFRQQSAEEDWIAQELGFGTPEVLYQQLSQDGFPVCTVCGETPVHSGHCERPRQQRQPDLGSGRRIKLPDASRARSLFRQALKELDMYIHFVDDEEGWLQGDFNEEEGQFKGKRFITHSVDRDVWEVARREEFTEEQWKVLCEQHGVDPSRDQFVLSVGVEASAGGVGRTPSTFLSRLIAMYALAHQPLPPLIEALHYDPETADMKKVYAKVEELREVAGHLASRVRGGVVERGRGVEEISHDEHFAAWLIHRFEEEGASSDEEINERLKKTFPKFADWLGLDPKEIARIRRQRLELPQ